LVPRFTYALADVLGASLRGKQPLAAPGCFATAAQLALYPLTRLSLASRPVLFAITGSSGAGVHPRATTHHPARAHNLFAYSVLQHRHDAEILQRWREWTGASSVAPRLLTHSGPMVRGIYLTMHVELQGNGESGKGKGAVREAFQTAYQGRPFVKLLPKPPELTHAVGTNYALIHVAESADGREAQVMVAIDNLIKGAGGQAIQAMNLSLGLPEESGLRGGGIFPC
jgi:N-acetyl-gamma-glutamyl-phosphate reductase